MSARSRFDILLISDEHLFMQMGTTWEENEGNPPQTPIWGIDNSQKQAIIKNGSRGGVVNILS